MTTRKQSTKKGGTKGKGRGSKKTSEAEGLTLDLVMVQQECERAARALFRLLDMPGLPPFISETLHMLLGHASRVKGVAIASDNPNGYSVKAITTLFGVTSGFQRGLTFEPVRELDAADHIAAILKDPALSANLRYGFGNVVTNEINNAIDTDRPRVLRAMLAELAEQKGGAR